MIFSDFDLRISRFRRLAAEMWQRLAAELNNRPVDLPCPPGTGRLTVFGAVQLLMRRFGAGLSQLMQHWTINCGASLQSASWGLVRSLKVPGDGTRPFYGRPNAAGSRPGQGAAAATRGRLGGDLARPRFAGCRTCARWCALLQRAGMHGVDGEHCRAPSWAIGRSSHARRAQPAPIRGGKWLRG